MRKTLILYESHTGFTETIANQMALILGPAFCSRASTFEGDPAAYDFIVLCTPGYSGIIDQKLLSFIEKNHESICTKRVVLLCTCLDEEEAFQCLSPLRKLLGQSVIFSSSVQEEAENQTIRLALEIKALRGDAGIPADPEYLDKAIEEFILHHNTCALATGYDTSVRATPIEYTYLKGFFYFLSEGGEKFANLLRNPAVSLCIFNEYTGMSDLSGMQIKGEAELVAVGSQEYRAILDHKKINFEKLRTLAVTLNMIKVTVKKIEFLYSAFSRDGLDVKQVKIL